MPQTHTERDTTEREKTEKKKFETGMQSKRFVQTIAEASA